MEYHDAVSGGHTLNSPEALVMSVRQRLQNIANKTGEPFQYVMERYVIERFLYRLGQSKQSDAFILKGATLFWVWNGAPHRRTRDLDMLKVGDSSHLALSDSVVEVASIPADDGILFDVDNLKLEDIREGTEYGGTRAVLEARLGAARLRLQIDIGVGDAVTPGPIRRNLPTLLDMPSPQVRCYPVETVIAEKLDAVVSRGLENSRMKDFYDLNFILQTFELDGAVISEAIRRTFERRGTALPTVTPLALTKVFYGAAKSQQQWLAFISRGRLASNSDFAITCHGIDEFSKPIFEALNSETPFNRRWVDGKWDADSL